MSKCITKDMISEINNELKKDECIFTIVQNQKDESWEIVPLNYNYIDTIKFCFSSEFFDKLISFFGKYNIAINFNNDGSVFWAL